MAWQKGKETWSKHDCSQDVMQGDDDTGSHIEKGFTLIELIVSMAIALIILAGMVGMFISQNRTQSEEINRLEVTGDMNLAAAIMKSELRQAKNVCWDAATKTLAYQPVDSDTVIPAACAIVANSKNGKFTLVNAGASGCSTSVTPCICWDRPNVAGGCQEMLRHMQSGTGLQVSNPGVVGGVWGITLKGVFMDSNHLSKTTVVDFNVWPRNQ